MVVNWPEIGLIVALNGVLVASVVLMGLRWGRRKYAEMKPKLFSEAEVWVGGAIGRFWQKLQEAAEEEGPEGSTAGMIKLGGFQMDVGTIKSLMEIAPQLLQLAQSFGLVKGGGGGGSNPFLKP